jgi:hypothetical protein
MPAKRGSGEVGTPAVQASPAKKQSLSSGDNGSTTTVAPVAVQTSDAGPEPVPSTPVPKAGGVSVSLPVPSTPVSKAGGESTPVSKAGGESTPVSKTPGGVDEHEERPPEENEQLMESVYMLLERMNSEFAVVFVLVIAVAFLNLNWTPAMMSASVIGALMTSIAGYSLHQGEYYRHTVGLLVLVVCVASMVTPDKTLNSIGAIKEQADSLIREYGAHQKYKKAAEECFHIQMKDPESPMSKAYTQKHGKFEPRKEESWNKRNTVAGCKLVRKPT